MSFTVNATLKSIKRAHVDSGRNRTFITLEVANVAEEVISRHKHLGDTVRISDDAYPSPVPTPLLSAIPSSVLLAELARRFKEQ